VYLVYHLYMYVNVYMYINVFCMQRSQTCLTEREQESGKGSMVLSSRMSIHPWIKVSSLVGGGRAYVVAVSFLQQHPLGAGSMIDRGWMAAVLMMNG
jgi:hypothetical protein